MRTNEISRVARKFPSFYISRINGDHIQGADGGCLSDWEVEGVVAQLVHTSQIPQGRLARSNFTLLLTG